MNNNQIVLMQVRIALILMLLLMVINSNTTSSSSNLLYLFTNDGTFYRMNAHTKEVDWYSSLNYKLISFYADQSQNATYFIPTIDGDFLYIDKNREMLIQRSQVQNLLDICFMGEKSSSKYFVYEKYEYNVLNSKTGQLQNLQDFIKEKKTIVSKGIKQPQWIIMSISKKFLKQLTSKLQVRWSAISSTVNLMTAEQFFKNPTYKPKFLKHSGFKFQRTGSKSITIQNTDDQSEFQLESSSPILSIFSFDEEKGTFSSHKMEIQQKTTLALQWKKDPIQNRSIIQKIKNINKNTNSFNPQINLQNLQNFPLVQKKQANQFPFHNTNLEEDNLLFCINTFRNIKRIEGNASKKIFTSQPPILPYTPIKLEPPIATKDQPIALIFSATVLLAIIYFLYRVGIRQILKELARLEESQQNKIEQLQKKIDNQIANVALKQDFDKSVHSIKWQNIIKKEEEFSLFDGKFLGKDVNVYVVATQNYSIVEKSIELLFKITLGKVSKLLYLSLIQNPLEEAKQIQRFSEVKHLGIFCQKNRNHLSKHNIANLLANKPPRQLINDIITTLIAINDKLILKRFEIDSIFIEENSFKIDPIPNILPIEVVERKKSSDSSIEDEQKQRMKSKPDIPFKLIGIRDKKFEVSDLQIDLINIIYFIETKGQTFNQSFLSYDQKNKILVNQNPAMFQLQDFLQSIIFQDPLNSTNSLLQSISQHPYLWDLKQRMLFVLDFSNYLETHTDNSKLSKLENTAKELEIIKIPWNRELHPSFTKEINSHRKYDYSSIRDLIRVVRNKVSHFHELPKDIRAHLGKTPQEFVEYFLVKFPKLLPFMHAYSQKKKWKLHV